jgi:hypothetical protein
VVPREGRALTTERVISRFRDELLGGARNGHSIGPRRGSRCKELAEDVTPRRFGIREALDRVEQHGDLFAPVLAGGQALGRALRTLR